MRKKKQNGFLLIEFLIIFGVISIIISIFFIKLKSIQEIVSFSGKETTSSKLLFSSEVFLISIFLFL